MQKEGEELAFPSHGNNRAFHETSWNGNSRNGRKKKHPQEKRELTLDNEEEIILIELENQIKKLTKKKVAGEDEVKNEV